MSKQNVMWLGFVVPDELAKKLFELDPLPAVQTHKFGWSFVRAMLGAFNEVTLASSCPIQNFPIVRRIIFRGSRFKSQGINGVQLGFINVLFFKHISRFVECLLVVAPLIKVKRIKWIFIHGVHTPYLVFGLFARLAGCRVAVVLTDPPGVILSTDGYLTCLLKRFDVILVRYFLRRVDAVFSVATDLVKRFAPDSPSLIFPGILDATLDLPLFTNLPFDGKKINADPFTIVYAGGLSRAYGVDLLIDAILGFDAEISIRLKLYGRGDQEARIRQLSAKDHRFFYGGFVDTKSLMPELCSADILINPRPTVELFASQSFPSKLIEYLATGRPVLTTRIKSIPDGLKDHFYFIDDESVHGIQLSVKAVMKISELDRAKHGCNARQFVEFNYSEANIGCKIYNFINELSC